MLNPTAPVVPSLSARAILLVYLRARLQEQGAFRLTSHELEAALPAWGFTRYAKRHTAGMYMRRWRELRAEPGELEAAGLAVTSETVPPNEGVWFVEAARPALTLVSDAPHRQAA